MPVTKSAKKALKRDLRNQRLNERIRRLYKEAVKHFRAQPTLENLRKATSALDRAAGKRVIHKNKASRLKSRLAKLLPKALESRKQKAEDRTGKRKTEKGKK